ncbi:DNA-binding transcriptional regulator, LysR family [Roseateles sp. YR242]|uniref:LysR family transcriptional regulator n=1 Tax=Roseateles sp. YR242 TaxID=1855305 RepID=UPI0008B1283C|nr:LysR family transcriptional regulator [Roseateles sp. YR242]SEL79521.1 DNA-binding transcriptional regulator, LysR family [Roseateles sp. YR242]
MELYQLKSFLAVVAERNLTRAAEKVFTSVPAVSAQIKALEEELGVLLFERSSRGMALTPAGERLAEEARRTMDAAQRMRQAAAQIRGAVQGVLRMGTVSDPIALRLGEVMVQLAQRHPEVALQLHQRLSLQSIHALRRGEVDCAYVLNADESVEGIRLHRLSRLEVVVAMPLQLAQTAWPQDLQALLALPWINTPPDCGLRPAMEALFASGSRELPQGPMAETEGAVRGMVASGMGLGLLRRDQAEAAERAGELRLWPHWSTVTWLCWMQKDTPHEEPALTALRELVTEVWR